MMIWSLILEHKWKSDWHFPLSKLATFVFLKIVLKEKRNSYFCYISFPQISSVNVCLMKTLKSTVIKKAILCLTLSFLVPRWAGGNTDLTSDINISKTVGVNIAFNRIYFHRTFNKLSNVMQVDRLCSCDSRVIDV